MNYHRFLLPPLPLFHEKAIIDMNINMKQRLTFLRLIVAVISMVIEQAAIWAVWRWLLPELNIYLDVWVLIVIMAAWLIIGIFLFIAGTRALTIREVKGLSSMVGMEGKAHGQLSPDGMVKIKGELWSARSEEGNIGSGEKITVTGEDGLKLIVRKT